MRDLPVGLYLSRCRGALDLLDVDALAARFKDSTAVCRVVDDLFSAEAQETMLNDVRELSLDGLVLAGNSVEHHTRSLSGPQLREALISAGVNPNRLAVANLLEQVALPHAGEPEAAAAKAAAILDEAMLQASTFPSVEIVETVPERSVLILGATTGGVVAAQRLLRLGFSVTIADRDPIDTSMPSITEQRATVAYVSTHPEVSFVGEAMLDDGDGWLGDYDLSLSTPEGVRQVHAGGILIADGRRWIGQLRRHYALAVGEDDLPLSLGRAHPAGTTDPGIMLLPGHDAADADSVIRAADVAALALVLHLSVPTVRRALATSTVDPELCGGCASCVKTCAAGACTIDPETGLSRVDPRRCRGCGKCVVSCPVGARDVVSSPHLQMITTIRSMAHADVPRPRVLGFLCGGCGYPAADEAGFRAAEGGTSYPASFLPVRIPCGGRLDALYVLEAIAAGFDGVAVFRCRDGHCQNLIGNLDMDRRINLLRTVLRSRGVDDARLRIIDISPHEGELFTEEVNGFFSELEPLSASEGSL